MKKVLVLSIIVPAYNAEKYIEKCLNSLLNQDLEGYEIIVINDGSTDKTVEIVSKYTERNNIISLISQENQGQGVARNVGISNARGKYIMFVDADDYVKVNSISLLIKRMEQDDLDLLCGNYEKVDTAGNILGKTKGEKLTKYTTNIINSSQFLFDNFGFCCYVPLFVFKKSFIQSLDFSFKPKIYLEDTEWLPKVIFYAKKISMIDYPFYHYVQTPKSAMRDESKLEKKLSDTLYVTKLMREFQINTIKDEGINKWFGEMLSINVIWLCGVLSKKELTPYNAIVCKTLVDLNIFPLKMKRMPLKFKLMSYLINFNWNLSVVLASIIHKIKTFIIHG